MRSSFTTGFEGPWRMHLPVGRALYHLLISSHPAEILLGHTYQAAPADVWALGILLSIIVTGESPFPSIAWAMNGQVQLKRPAPRAVMEILSMCFVPDPRARPNVEAILRHPWVTGYRGSI